ncbi:sigma-B regulation protein RsbU (phosphoserine phosphatase) [Silvibacterium bohemicum]|uniref:Sigma-B regulation protein RsbU (Phosphoserine phosphatase) n=1 Tax=Silvibacterium bohemicum TaxID=1577686 RepID=A0A841JX02_9BACT|nr:SpoIIE family protein phosphatase [Silvibacterium bohemicum]MBB6144967.1 sigma-B regulation protein RsbU (phosphoserine phosphatase) [Silvibacterium bohemicum]
MTDEPTQTAAGQEVFEGDYRPTTAASGPTQVRIEPLSTEFLIRLADALNTTLDLQTLLKRTADLVRAVIDYRIFAILLLNDRTSDLRMRFQIGHTLEIERMRIKLGHGVVGQVAQQRQAILIPDVAQAENYINANPSVRSELAVPLIVKNRLIGVIDIQSEQPNYFSPEHLRLLQLTASRVGQAIENARLYTRVARQAQTLEVLNEISRELTSILDVDALLERVGQLLRRIIDFQMFSVWLLNESDQVLENRFAVRFGERFYPTETIPIDRGLVGAAMSERRVVHVADVRKDPRYRMVNPEARSEMAVPLVYKGKVIGVLDIEHTRTNYFNEDHERAMSTLAAQIAISIENAQLYQRVAHQEQRLERDLAMAREVQLRLLPPTKPQHKQAEFSARFIPARTIGGDLYDFISYDANRSAIALGDVSGKAAPAALYAALVSGIMRSAANQLLSPSALLATLNDALQERKLDSQYVCMLYGLWNDDNRTLQIANAGAVQPLVCRGGEVETVHAEGFPLGMFPNVTYEEFSLATQPGDSIIFFSDGIVDAQNAEGDMFGDDRLKAIVKKFNQKSASKIADAILAEVSKFQGGKERFDDETVVVLKVL